VGEPKELIFRREDGIGIITLNRPEKRNAITTPMYEDLRNILEEVRKRDEIKVVVVTGSGTAFCAGSDAETRLLPRVAADHFVRLERTRAELLEPVMLYLAPSFYNLGKPSIAAINGVAAGAGLSIALLCDIRIASERARFGAGWVKIGLTPDLGATFLLPRIIGIDRALKLFYTGEFVDAEEAERIGLVTQVVPHEELMRVTKELATKIAEGPSVAIELTKRAVYRGVVNDFMSQLYFENYAQDICFATDDFREGVKSFQQKRQPAFKGF